MYTTAFDASGKEDDQDYVVVAGFVSTAKIWKEFDRAWRSRLAEDQLAFFHMREWHHRTGLFRDREYWTRERCSRLIDDLLEIILSHASAKFSCAVINKSYAANISEANKRRFLLNAYVLAARAVIELVHEWTLYRDNRPVEHVFEEGDEGKGMLIERMQIEGLHKPSFRWGKDTTHRRTKASIPGFTPLQASDIYAYEVFRFAKDFSTKGNVKSDVLRGLDPVHGEPRTFSIQDLQQLDGMIDQMAADPEFWAKHRSL